MWCVEVAAVDAALKQQLASRVSRSRYIPALSSTDEWIQLKAIGATTAAQLDKQFADASREVTDIGMLCFFLDLSSHGC